MIERMSLSDGKAEAETEEKVQRDVPAVLHTATTTHRSAKRGRGSFTTSTCSHEDMYIVHSQTQKKHKHKNMMFRFHVFDKSNP